MEKKIKKIVAIALAVILIAAIPVAVPASALGNSITFSVSLTAESDRIAAMAQPKDNGLCLAITCVISCIFSYIYIPRSW